MREASGKKYVFLLSLLSLALFFTGTWDRGIERGDFVEEGIETAFFHGKHTGPGITESTCRNSTGCHGQFPHKEDRRLSAFVNMHGYFLDCLVCHGLSGTTLLPESTRGRRIIRAKEGAPVTDPHGAIEKPLTCRDCHSPEGMSRLEERARTKFKPGFTDPFALKLIEEDRKKWEVPGM